MSKKKYLKILKEHLSAQKCTFSKITPPRTFGKSRRTLFGKIKNSQKPLTSRKIWDMLLLRKLRRF